MEKKAKSSAKTPAHTPGPWRIVRAPSGVLCIDHAAIHLAYLDPPAIISDEEKIADARLIAAAPELLRELKVAALFLEHVPSEVLEQICNELDCDLAAENIFGAIAKAEGKEA